MSVAQSQQEAGTALQKICAISGVRSVKSDLRVVAPVAKKIVKQR